MMIASGILLCGCLLALRYPSNREEEFFVAQTVEADDNIKPSSLTSTPDQASVASRNDEERRFASIDDFIRDDRTADQRSDNFGFSHTTMTEPDVSETETFRQERMYYADMPVNPTVEIPNTEPSPPYQPFQMIESVTLPEQNPAFFAELPAPPNLTGLMAASGSFSGNVISPSAMMQPDMIPPAFAATNVTVSDLGVPPMISTTTIVARPVVPTTEIQSEKIATVGTPGTVPVVKPKNSVIFSPAIIPGK
ncbi:MAG: hypothetical protein FWD31_15165 [Planctomycetaceae bacterium]|nr:hypothetical protein [Planctomycetaceae bacterium]